MIEKLLNTIENYQSSAPFDTVLKDQFTQFIRANPDNCLLRSNLSGHLTASAWVIDSETKSRALLVNHVKLNRWLQPGGHADGDSNLMHVAQKELEEETGIKAEISNPQIFDLDVHAIPWHKQIPPHLHFDVRYLFLASAKAPLSISEESRELAWVDLAALELRGVDESVLRLAEKSQLIF
jgi:8-oxo-dGTP pyrophosphatase MutT (NUDIX family)